MRRSRALLVLVALSAIGGTRKGLVALTRWLLTRFGVTATCRASFAMYNTKEEVDILAHALLKAQDIFA